MINSSDAGSYSHVDELDFERIDMILDASESAMFVVASEHQLREVKVERWRWDKPEILMSWAPFRQFPSVGKNIRTLVNPEADSFICVFESNAWYDERQSPDSFTRYWDHFLVGDIPIADPQATLANEASSIRKYLELAYEKVTDAREIRLDHAIRISSNGESYPTDGAVLISDNAIRRVAAAVAD